MCFEMIIFYTKTKTDFCTVAFQRYKMSSNDDIHRVFLNKPSQLIAFLSKRVQLQTQRFVPSVCVTESFLPKYVFLL